MDESPLFHSDRSHHFIVSFQIQGLCEALRFTLQSNNVVGPTAIKMLKSFRDQLIESGSGAALENIPEVTPDLTSSDLLAISEVLRVTYMAFLTPKKLKINGRQ